MNNERKEKDNKRSWFLFGISTACTLVMIERFLAAKICSSFKISTINFFCIFCSSFYRQIFEWVENLGLRCYKCWLKYDEGSLTTTVDVKSINDLEFPAIAICPQYENSHKLDVLEKYGLGLHSYKRYKGIYLNLKLPKLNENNFVIGVLRLLHLTIRMARTFLKSTKRPPLHCMKLLRE